MFFFFFHLIRVITYTDKWTTHNWIRNKIAPSPDLFTFFSSSPSQLSRAAAPSPPHGPHRSFSHHSLSCSPAVTLSLISLLAIVLSSPPLFVRGDVQKLFSDEPTTRVCARRRWDSSHMLAASGDSFRL
jgi:hypothetical protein